MKVTMITSYAGPLGTCVEGGVIILPNDEAKRLIDGGYAVSAEPPKPPKPPKAPAKEPKEPKEPKAPAKKKTETATDKKSETATEV